MRKNNIESRLRFLKGFRHVWKYHYKCRTVRISETKMQQAFSACCIMDIIRVLKKLPLGVLRSFSRLVQTVFLSFDHSWIACKETRRLECRLELFRVEFGKCP